MIMSEIHNHITYPEELKLCPFCGKRPYWYLKGRNEPFYKKSITIKCDCGVTMEQSAIRYDVEWLKEQMIEKWNNRV